jgi:hypothetical protein
VAQSRSFSCRNKAVQLALSSFDPSATASTSRKPSSFTPIATNSETLRTSTHDFNKLVRDIRARGLIHPVVAHHGVVLDGRNRLRACKELGMTPKFVEFDSLGLKCSPERYIWSATTSSAAT